MTVASAAADRTVEASAPRRRVRVFTLGGTIASRSDDSGRVKVTVSGDDLLAGCPGATEIADVELVAISSAPSVDSQLRDLLALARDIDDAFRAGCDGVVVVQGTDTLEESAYALDLLVRADRPVVLTGAMRPSDALGADGPANLMAAIRVAASREADGVGAVVVMNDQIHAARFVRKWHPTLPSAFSSPTVGPVGYLVEDRVRIPLRPQGRLTISVDRAAAAPAPVAQVVMGLGTDERMIRVIPSLGYGGLVVGGLGGGHVPSWVAPALTKVASEIPVVIASRTGSGEGPLETYGYSGSETDLRARGLVQSRGLSTTQAAVLLSLLVLIGHPRAQLAAAFEAATAPRGHVRLGSSKPG